MKDYRSRFGFHTTPFTREISVNHFFNHPMFEEAQKALIDTVEHRMCAALIAPPGLGKTFVLRSIENSLPESRYRVKYIKVCGLSKRDMCREITDVLGCAAAGSYNILIRRLQEYLLHNVDVDGLRPVLLIDEGQSLRLEVLSMLKILANFDMDSRLVVSIILSGQPPLQAMLRRNDLEDVATRFSHFATLRAFTREETYNYIKHRSSIAGAGIDPFDHQALDAIFEVARGNMRAIDHLALKSLQIAHDSNCSTVDSNHVALARKFLCP